jgi:hypothetical protein
VSRLSFIFVAESQSFTFFCYYVCKHPVLVQLLTPSTAATALSKSRGMLPYVRPLGAAAVVFGLIILSIGAYHQENYLLAFNVLLGVTRFFSIQIALTKGRFPVARISIAGMSIGVAVLTVISFGVVVAVAKLT